MPYPWEVGPGLPSGMGPFATRHRRELHREWVAYHIPICEGLGCHQGTMCHLLKGCRGYNSTEITTEPSLPSSHPGW
jgi:hypothetical protein